MNERDRQQRVYVIKIADQLRRGAIDRRRFVRDLSMAGFGIASARYLSGSTVKQTALPKHLPANLTQPQQHFLREAGGHFKGTKLRIVSEDTRPTLIISRMAKEEFTPLTGIDVEWEIVPLDQVLANTVRDTLTGPRGHKGRNDIYYWDQAWLARFSSDSVHLDELQAKKDLAYPDYRFDDFLPELVDVTASVNGRIIGIPFDIPIFIMMYRRDILEHLRLGVPKTLSEYLHVVKIIQEAKHREGIYGTVGQWKSGHYALQSEASSWLWSHGGHHFERNGRPDYVTEGNRKGLECMMELGRSMDPAVVDWDWGGQYNAFAGGKAGVMISWSEFFPGFDDPSQSKVVGLVEAADCPIEDAKLSKADCGYGEIPGISRQGGSCLALSRYAPHPDAAWIFMQWATSADVTARANALGSNTPTRASNYIDPRVKSNAQHGIGTTRHFEVTRRAIETRMGTGPRLSIWPTIATEINATGYGRMTRRQQSIDETLKTIQRKTETALAKAHEG